MKRLFYYNSPDGKDPASTVLLISVTGDHLMAAVSDREAKILGTVLSVALYDSPPNQLDQAYPFLSDPYLKVIMLMDEHQYALDEIRPGNASPDPLLWDWLMKKFPAARWITAADLFSKYPDPGYIRIDFGTRNFRLVCWEHGNVIFNQPYPYVTSGDIIYYTLRCCQVLGIAQGEARLKVSGWIDKESNLARDLAQYFPAISYKDASWDMPGDEHPRHYLTILNELARCAL